MKRGLWLAAVGLACIYACSAPSPAHPGKDGGTGQDGGSVDGGTQDGGGGPGDGGGAFDAGFCPNGTTPLCPIDSIANEGQPCAQSGAGCVTSACCSERCSASCYEFSCVNGTWQSHEQAAGHDPVCDGGVADGGLGAGEVCTSSEECRSGLLCCYPCGIPDCENRCTEVGDAGRCPRVL